MTSITLLLILAATAALAWAGTGLIIRNAVAWGLEDIPNERSSHTRITPRGGGAAIVAASLGGFLLLTLAVVAMPHLVGLGQPLDQGTFANLLAQDTAWLYSLGPLVWIALPLLFAALVLGILGLQDDRQPLSIRLRLGFQLFCCAWLLVVLSSLPGAGGAWAGLKEQLWQLLSGWGLPGMSESFTQAEARDALLPALMTLGLVVALMLLGTWWINLYNFMDGIDGIAASQALFMLLGAVLLRSLSFVSALGTVPDTAPLHCSPNGPAGQLFATDGLLACLHLENLMTDPFSTASLIVAAAVAGFLMWNWAPARIFMGDAGSLFLGNIILILAVIEAMIWLGETQQQLTRPVNPDGVAHVIHGVPPASWFILGALFITDATVTLMRRILSGQRPGDPHRSHLYQRLARRFGSHARVTLVYCLINVFWLLPLAALARLLPGAGMSMVLLAYVPLVLLAWLLGAGRPEPAGT